MNRETVIQLAREAGMYVMGNLAAYSDSEELERFANTIKQRTLERAARVCDEQASRSEASMLKAKGVKARDVYSAVCQTALWNAAAIRALKESQNGTQ